MNALLQFHEILWQIAANSGAPLTPVQAIVGQSNPTMTCRCRRCGTQARRRQKRAERALRLFRPERHDELPGLQGGDAAVARQAPSPCDARRLTGASRFRTEDASGMWWRSGCAPSRGDVACLRRNPKRASRSDAALWQSDARGARNVLRPEPSLPVKSQR